MYFYSLMLISTSLNDDMMIQSVWSWIHSSSNAYYQWWITQFRMHMNGWHAQTANYICGQELWGLDTKFSIWKSFVKLYNIHVSYAEKWPYSLHGLSQSPSEDLQYDRRDFALFWSDVEWFRVKMYTDSWSPGNLSKKQTVINKTGLTCWRITAW